MWGIVWKQTIGAAVRQVLRRDPRRWAQACRAAVGERIFAFDDARLAAEQLELHRGDRKHIAGQLPILREMLNASFAQLGYYTEISAEQLARQTDGLAYLLDESLLLNPTKAGRPSRSYYPSPIYPNS